ncbi:hypothetical protein OQJ19_14630 [Fluoribacter gormanii]|uniref:Uncharacterized protein n=1 Tax=Fluoribacter gormanii TaxID=464 RepID=A0A377GKG5_9GAMM|nr:hypothetical protein [Fluoribacter gormanii]KTD00907.1 hypothetical protein Lgor_2824 [Fluoribacter gormanii]MCW8471865.1 hypothetical protein [Fluoribacter gormanii]SIQ81318.1 hypothetical protein SAMN05421777_103135 [Fluoribacter gormanii]STO25025.1 Uncharacterised protein [Fluoribacter gormanii]
MKFLHGLFLVSSLIYQNAYAEKALSPPTGQSAQCQEAYERSGQIKTISNVFSSLSNNCYSAGGMKLMHKILLSENSNEPTGVLFTCTGSDLNFVVFSCLFSTN